MDDDLSQVALARLASGLTIEDISRVLGISQREYKMREDRPLELSLGELKTLSSELNSDGKEVLSAWLRHLFA